MHSSPLPYTESSLPSNFTDALLALFKVLGAKDALIDPESGQCIRFDEFQPKIGGICATLLARGLGEGQRVATVVGNSLDYLLFVLSCLKLGVVVVPLNPASKEGEIAKYTSECRVETILLESDLSELVRGATESPYPDGYHSGLALIFFSSGTTGPPKAICHSHTGLVAHLHQWAIILQATVFPTVSREDIVHGVLPYFHFGGLMTVLLMLATGATVVLNKRWDGESYLRVLKDYKVTMTNVVPPILTFLDRHPSANRDSLESLKRVYVGAAACDPLVLGRVRQKLGVEVVQLFGMTEAGLALLMSPTWSCQDSTVGVPLPGVDCKFTQEGELLVRSPTLMSGYSNSSEPFLDQDGFFNTGDLAAVDANGLFSIVGRKKDTFKVKGWQVNPWEIEEVIRLIPGVVDCCVVGMPHPTDGRRAKAFVVGSVEVEEVKERVKKELISYKQVEEVVLVESLPRNPAGKVLRRELEQQ